MESSDDEEKEERHATLLGERGTNRFKGGSDGEEEKKDGAPSAPSAALSEPGDYSNPLKSPAEGRSFSDDGGGAPTRPVRRLSTGSMHSVGSGAASDSSLILAELRTTAYGARRVRPARNTEVGGKKLNGSSSSSSSSNGRNNDSSSSSSSANNARSGVSMKNASSGQTVPISNKTPSSTSRPTLQARPGLLVKQRTTRNVHTARTTSFVPTAGLQRARAKQAQQAQQEGGGAASTCGNGTMGRSSGVSVSSSVGGGSVGDCNANSDPSLGTMREDFLEIDLCDECLHCPSLTALRQSFHECLGQGDGSSACRKAEEETGRLPLHCIGLNRDLILLSTGNAGASIARVDEFILKELLPAYPSAIINEDEEGRLPFTEVIIKWIAARRAVRLWKSDLKKKRAERLKRNAEREARRVRARFAERYSVNSAGSGYDDDDEYQEDYAAYMENEDEDEDDVDDLHEDNDDLSVESLGEDVMEQIREVCGEDEDEDDDEEFHDLPPLAEWSLRMLSLVIDQPPNQLGCAASNLALKSEMHESGATRMSSSGMSGTSDNDSTGPMDGGRRASVMKRPSLMNVSRAAVNMVYDDIVVEKLAAIPHLVEELLLIEDKAARSRVFELSIVHKVLFEKNSLGDGKWLMSMLNKGIHEGAQVNVFIGSGNKYESRRSMSRRGSLNSMDSNVGSMRNLNLAWGQPDSTRDSIMSMFSNSKESESMAAKVVGGIVDNEGYKYAEAGVFYLEAISHLHIQDDLHVLHHLQMMQGHLTCSNMAEMVGRSDLRHFLKKRDDLYDTIGSICGLIRILSVLDADLVTRATATPVVQRALDRRIFSPFAMTIAVIDGVVHFLLILAFRLGPSPAMFHLNPVDTGFRPLQYVFANMLLFTCLLHFFTKELQLSFAKYSLSPRLFWSDFFTFWNLLGIVPLFFVAFCSIAIDLHLRWRALDVESQDSGIPFYLRVAVAVTIPFLWLRVLGHLKMWNKQLATFILCSVEIMKDIKWFMLVLLIAMSSFAQMFVSLTFEPANTAGPGEEYKYFSLEGYLKAYTIMLGDFDSMSLKKHPSITLLFVLYTFGVTIVLLNILIAIVSDSYSTSTTTSKTMLGKARIMFVSELSSLHHFFRKMLSGDGKLKEAQRNMDIASFAVGALATKLFVSTTKSKLHRSGGGTAGWLLFHPSNSYWFDLEALGLFFFFCAVVAAIKVIMAHIQRNFRYSTSVKKHDIEVKSEVTQKINDCIEEMFAFVSSGVDFLTEEDDSKLLSESAQTVGQGETANMNQTDTQLVRLRRTMHGNKKEMKTEMKHVTEQLQHALTESEHHHHGKMVGLEERIHAAVADSKREIASMIEASEDRMIRAITAALCSAGGDNGGTV